MSNLLISVLVAFVALVGTTGAQSPCVNGQPEHYPHPTDCGLYYTCAGDVPILQSCPDGTWYNPVNGVCDWPDNVDCAAATSTTPSTTPSTISTTPTTVSTTPSTISTTPSTTATTVSTSALPTEGPVGPPKECPAVDDPDNRVRYPHETECPLYYLCTDGVPLLYTCLPNFEFNPWRRNCFPITEAGCSQCPTVEVEEEKVRLPHESVCHYYYLCTQGSPALYQCSADLLFSRIDRWCLVKEEAYCWLPNDAIREE